MFSGLLVGAMLPYWFSAMTMKSVGKAALAMVEEVRRQFATIPGIMDGTARPDYRLCVEISTQASAAHAGSLDPIMPQGWLSELDRGVFEGRLGAALLPLLAGRQMLLRRAPGTPAACHQR